MVADERAPPSWLNEELFTTALREGWKLPTLEVTSCSLKPATAIGDNYASIMFRAQLQFRKTPNGPSETVSVVCKTLPPGQQIQDIMVESRVFEKEAHSIGTVLPAINELLKKIYPDEQPLCADLIWFGTKPEQIIILQDLKELGFANLDRMAGLDFQASTMVVRALARLHAASYFISRTNPQLLSDLKENIWLDQKNDSMEKMLNSSLSSLIAEASEWNDFSEEYLQKLKNLTTTILPKVQDALRYNEESLNVMQHGDCWINNIMFSKESNGKLSGLRFVDFQICYMNSAAADLNYFLFTSPQKDIRFSKINEMLETYYAEFTDAVTKLNIDLPKSFDLDELKREFRARAFFGFVGIIIVYPITVTESKDALNTDDFFDEGDKKRGMYRSKAFKEVFLTGLPYFIECGVI